MVRMQRQMVSNKKWLKFGLLGFYEGKIKIKCGPVTEFSNTAKLTSRDTARKWASLDNYTYILQNYPERLSGSPLILSSAL